MSRQPRRGPVLGVALGAVGLGTLAASLTTISLLTRWTPLRAELGIPSALHQHLPGACSWVAMPWALAPVALAVVAAFAVIATSRSRASALISTALVVAMVAAAVTAVASSLTAGVLVALAVLVAFGPVTGAVHARYRAPSRTTMDDLLRLSGFWLAAVGLLCMVVAAATPAAPPWARACDVLPAPWPSPALLLPLLTVTLGLGLFTAAVGVTRRHRHDAWWARVLRGEDPEWMVVAEEELGNEVAELPALANDDLPHDGVVVRRCQGVAAGAYRTGRELEPYARVWLPVDYYR